MMNATQTNTSRSQEQKGSTMYAIATGLRGFRVSTLRVRIVRDLQGCYDVVTADLLDAGTPLILSKDKVQLETPCEVISHKSGLVQFAV